MSKLKTIKSHFKRRIWERYGIHCNDSIYREIINKIQHGDSKFIERQSNRVTIHDIVVSEKEIRVAYDSVRSALITALPAYTLNLGNDWRLFK